MRGEIASLWGSWKEKGDCTDAQGRVMAGLQASCESRPARIGAGVFGRRSTGLLVRIEKRWTAEEKGAGGVGPGCLSIPGICGETEVRRCEKKARAVRGLSGKEDDNDGSWNGKGMNENKCGFARVLETEWDMRGSGTGPPVLRAVETWQRTEKKGWPGERRGGRKGRCGVGGWGEPGYEANLAS